MAAFDKILEWEERKLSNEDAVKMFQELVDSGDIWKLPDGYQDQAAMLYVTGHISISAPKTLN